MNEQSDYQARFSGIARLYGQAAARLRQAHVCVVGLGGVGSWTVEALARTGIGSLTLVDLDEICVSNMNRQLPALSSSVGRTKVSVLQERVREINPECVVQAREEFFTRLTVDAIFATRFDAVLDAIDSVSNKCLLIARCRAEGIPVVTVGAAGGRRDPTQTKVADLTLANHDRLLQQVRKVLRQEHSFPRGKAAFGVPAIFSPEPAIRPEGIACSGPIDCETGYGTVSFVTGTFDFTAASVIVQQLTQS